MVFGGETEAGRSRRVQDVIRGCIRRRVAGECLPDEELASDHSDLMPELGEELRALALIQQAEQRASDTANRVNAATADVALPADSFPGYEITGEIHRGGQGVVYEALQKSTDRKVAIKVMREGPFGCPGDRVRFEREVQILGQLRHPHIVTIHDSGSAAGGFYFVMDYIAGSALDEFMARQERSIPEILELFTRVCDAVNAAHLRGIIHRDLKPSNIRVDMEGEPHVLDFGLAKITNGGDMRGGMTMTGQFIGSVPWASPEQAEGLPQKIDMRTDVYSLGMILYHMLTGRFPYEVTGSIRDVIDNILNAEPIRPSAIRRRINNEVETIVLKCLSKEPERRYQTAGELVRDIRRYLAGETIEAKRDSVGYVLRKHLRRYRLPVAVVATFMLVVTAGFVTSLAFWRDAVGERNAAEAARTEAQRQADIAQAVNDFLNRDLLAAVDPRNTTNRKITVKEVLDAASVEVDGAFDEQPLVEAAIRTTLGTTYRQLGEYDTAEPHLERAVELRIRELGNEHLVTVGTTNELALLYQAQGRYDEAEPLLVRALEIRRTVLGDEDPYTLTSANNLAILYDRQGRYAEADALCKTTLEIRQRVFGEEHPKTLVSMNNLAVRYCDLGRYDEAEALCARTLELRKRVLGQEHPETLVTMGNLALAYRKQGRYEDASELYKSALNTARRVLGEEHPQTLSFMNFLGHAYVQLEWYDEAETLFVNLLELRRQVLGEQHPNTLASMSNLAQLYLRRGRYGEAERLHTATLDLQRRVVGEEHPDTLASMDSLAALYRTLGRYDEAEQLYIEVLELRRRVLGEEHPRTLNTLTGFGKLQQLQGRYDEAELAFTEVLEIHRRVVGDGQYRTLGSMYTLGMLYVAQGRYEKAEPLLVETMEVLFRLRGEEHPATLKTMHALAIVYKEQGRFEEAESLARKLIAQQNDGSEPSSSDVADSLNLLADIRTRVGDPADAELLLRECLEIRKGSQPEDDRLIARTESLLGGSLTAQGRYEEAEVLLLGSYARIAFPGEESDEVTRSACQRIIDLYDAWGNPAKVAEWQAKLRLEQEVGD